MSSNQTKTKQILIDTDAGVDDAIAICLALKHRSVHVRAITCSFGNTSLRNVVENVAQCVYHCSADSTPTIPFVHIGAESGMSGEAADASYFHGKDGLGDAGLPAVPTPFTDKLISTEEAPSVILRLAEESKQENTPLTIVTLGPLTNLAKVLKLDPNFAASNEHIDLVVMGGCGNAHGNATRVSEFNVHSDVEAASVVFSQWNSPSLTVIPWELNILRPLPWKSFEKFIAPTQQTSRTSDFLTKITAKIYVVPEDPPKEGKDGNKRSSEGAVICDALAVAVGIDPGGVITGFTQTHVEVDTRKGMTKGMTLCDWGCYDGVERPKNVKWVTDVNVKKYEELLEQALID
ncbi:hypothetical protein TrVE_jg3556 [Triparma verrucosa]|uniref:Inosine/uridine-preferring nucleoside hydrolase domain-containing protein n=1 Tax=Triparma verrucosa TaxID=1606542 RepID=A0A9W7KXJ6_9STRA|nr:hypothetical protein TrVE_jg3556 [Triparma verrucosa]